MASKLVSVLMVILLSSCGGGGGGSSTPSKDISSIWEAVDTNFVIDLREATLNEPISFLFLDTDKETILCTCSAQLTGTKYAGSYALDCSSCSAPYDVLVFTNGSYNISSSNNVTFCDVVGDTSTCAVYE